MFLTLNLKKCIKFTAAIAAAVTLILTISLTSCGTNEDIHTRIYRKYSNIQSFSAVVDVTVNTERTANTYQMRQYYRSPDMFREDVLAPENLAGMTYIFTGGTMLIIPPNEGESIQFENIPENRSYTFLPEFFRRYFDSKVTTVAVTTETTDETPANETETILEVTLDGGNAYRAAQKLWIDNETLQPLRLETHDANGTPLVTVIFTEFNLNERVDDEIFSELAVETFAPVAQGLRRVAP